MNTPRQHHAAVDQQAHTHQQLGGTRGGILATLEQQPDRLYRQQTRDRGVHTHEEIRVAVVHPVMDVEGDHDSDAGGHCPPGQGTPHEVKDADQKQGFTGQLTRIAQHIEHRAAGGDKAEKQDDTGNQRPAAGHPEHRASVGT